MLMFLGLYDFTSTHAVKSETSWTARADLIKFKLVV